MIFRHLRLTLLWLSLLLTSAAIQAAERWVLIDTQARHAQVFDGQTAIVRFDYLAIGSRGTAEARVAGDMTTPLGEFRITRIDRASRFRTFLALDYPTLRDADRALEQGLISPTDYWQFFDLLLEHGRSPQNGPLGGHIGIHGLGAGSPETHRLFDWTRGCIALTNEQIDVLASLVRVGTRVVIK